MYEISPYIRLLNPRYEQASLQLVRCQDKFDLNNVRLRLEPIRIENTVREEQP